jgi:hypothetical protein
MNTYVFTLLNGKFRMQFCCESPDFPGALTQAHLQSRTLAIVAVRIVDEDATDRVLFDFES